MKSILNTIFLFIMLSAAAPALSQSDFEATKTLAEQGVAWAQNDTGYAYSTGEGVPQNYAEAVKWYRLAANGLI